MQLLATLVLAAVTGAQSLPAGKTINVPNAAAAAPFVEETIDRGDTVDLVVRCPKGTATVSYSKSRRQFCARDLTCATTLAEAAARSCG